MTRRINRIFFINNLVIISIICIRCLLYTSTATISYLATDAAATLAETNKGQNGWYTSTVTIQAPAGYTISSTLEGTYAADFTTDTNGKNTYYLRQDSSGFITDARTIQVPIDTDQPSGGKTDLSDAALRVGWYLSKENITVTQSVEDATSGPDHIEYRLTPSTDSEGCLLYTSGEGFSSSVHPADLERR